MAHFFTVSAPSAPALQLLALPESEPHLQRPRGKSDHGGEGLQVQQPLQTELVYGEVLQQESREPDEMQLFL